MIEPLTADERAQEHRHLLAAVARWTRHVGWKSTRRGWMDADETVAVVADDESIRVWHQHPGTKLWPITPREYVVESVSQGVDVLCALGILPWELSTGWRVGQMAPEVPPAPGIVRVWDYQGYRWDRCGVDEWRVIDDEHEAYELADVADWLNLTQAYGPVSVLPPLLVGGEPE